MNAGGTGGRLISESAFTIVCNGFADGPAQALRDHLCAEGAREVVMVSHPLTAEGGGGHVVTLHQGSTTTTHTARAPHRPPLTYPLDLVVPLRYRRSDLWIGFNPLAALRGLVERRLGRAGGVVTWNVDFVPDRFGPGLVTRAYDTVDRFVASRCDGRVELSIAARDGRNARLGLDPARSAPVSVVPMGAWIDRVPTTGEADWAPRARLAYLGHLVPRQGVATMLEAMALLCSEGVEVEADIVGGGPELDALRSRAGELGLGSLVTFHGFVADSSEVERILAGSHLGVAPYVDDGTSFTQFADPGKLKAYAAAGLPIVVTPVPPNAPDLVEAGAAVIVDDSPAGVAGGIREWMSSPDRWEVGRRSALTYAGGFDWGVLLTAWLRELGFHSDGRTPT